MITLYRPVLISSAEQAEALPIGTVAVRLDDDGLVWTAARRCRCEESGCDAWFSTDWADPEPHAGLVGHTALVPIEVEVEYIRESGGRRREKTLYVTPWVSSGPDSAAAEAQALADCGDES